MELIPVFNDYADYSESVVLDGSPYRLAFSWNTRGEYWSLTVSDSSGNVLVDGLKLIINFELISEYAAAGFPLGALMAIDTTGTLTRIGRNDLGEKVKLYYLTGEELAQVLDAAEAV